MWFTLDSASSERVSILSSNLSTDRIVRVQYRHVNPDGVVLGFSYVILGHDPRGLIEITVLFFLSVLLYTYSILTLRLLTYLL